MAMGQIGPAVTAGLFVYFDYALFNYSTEAVAMRQAITIINLPGAHESELALRGRS